MLLHLVFSLPLALVSAEDVGYAADTAQQRPRMKFGGKVYDSWDGNERYLHYKDLPSPADTYNAQLAGGDIKCGACAAILRDLLNGLASKKQLGQGKDEDVLINSLQAELTDEQKLAERKKTQSDMERYVALKRSGCNKLFKDSYLGQGWVIDKCHKLAKDQNHNTPTEHQAPWACARQSRRLPTTKDMDSYRVHNEAAWHACESTIGRNRDEIAASLAEKLRTVTHDKLKLEEVCKTAGQCLKRKQSESAEARVKVIMDRLYSQDKDVDELLAKMQKKLHNQKKKSGNKADAEEAEAEEDDDDDDDEAEAPQKVETVEL